MENNLEEIIEVETKAIKEKLDKLMREEAKAITRMNSLNDRLANGGSLCQIDYMTARDNLSKIQSDIYWVRHWINVDAGMYDESEEDNGLDDECDICECYLCKCKHD